MHRYKVGRTVVGAAKVLARMRRSTNVERNADADDRMKNAWDAGVHDGVFASPVATLTLGFEWMLTQRDYAYVTAGLPVSDSANEATATVQSNSVAGSEDSEGSEGQESVQPSTLWESAMYVLRDRLAGVLCCSPRDIQVQAALRSDGDYIANWPRDRLWRAGAYQTNAAALSFSMLVSVRSVKFSLN